MGIQGFKIIARQRARLVGRMLAIEKNAAAEQVELVSLRAKIAAFDEVLAEQGIGSCQQRCRVNQADFSNTSG